ncbi:MAG: sugar phosphate isomerase/epimerase family protein [Candidatus Bathyarchaeia archaeon]
MNLPWENKLRLSVVHALAYPTAQPGDSYYLDSVKRLANDDFFSVLEIVWLNDINLRKIVREIVESAHVKLTYAAQPALLSQRLDLSSPNDSDRKIAVDQMKSCIDEAAELGAERMSLLSGFYRGDQERNQSMRLLVDSLNEVCSYGEQKRIPITLEAFDREVEKKCLIGPAEDAVELASAVRRNHPDFGIMYDMAHGPLLNETPRHGLNLLKRYLVHVHLGNCVKSDSTNPAFGDKHPRFGINGGEHDVDELVRFIRILFDIGYIRRKPMRGRLPIVGFEVKPMPGEDPDTVIAGTKRVWREAWARLDLR